MYICLSSYVVSEVFIVARLPIFWQLVISVFLYVLIPGERFIVMFRKYWYVLIEPFQLIC